VISAIQILKKVHNRIRLLNSNITRIYLPRLIFKFDVKTRFRFRSGIVLSSNFGGLGDNLQISSLPEEFWKQYGKQTYISASSNHRNNEIFDLVWKCNPYVSGKSKKRPTAGDLPAWSALKNPDITNLVSHWEYIHGLNVSNNSPKIYYEPTRMSEFKNTVILDLSSISLYPAPGLNTVNSYNPELLKMVVGDQLEKFRSYELVNIVFKDGLAGDGVSLKNTFLEDFGYASKNIRVKNIFDYVDLIASSRAILTVYSGAAVLASSVKKYNRDLQIFTFITHQNYAHEMNNPNYLFDNVEYIKY
jgi:hypothetical protein